MFYKLVQFDNSLKSRTDLAAKWQLLEKQTANSNYFVSWHWIGVWLETTDAAFYLLECFEEERLIGLGVFASDMSVNANTLYLHKTGEQKKDQIWVEHNNFLTYEAHRYTITAGAINYLLSELSDYQNIHVDMSECIELAFTEKFYVREKLASVGYSKFLAPDQSISLIDTFSKNTKKQVTRSLRLLEGMGNLHLVEITADNKQQALADISERHKIQWQDSEWGSGFNNEHFFQFHQKMIEKENSVLLSIQLDDLVLGYGYFYCYQNEVLFYLSALDKHPDNKVKIGLTFHALAMEYFREKGFLKYDFLAGDARYKKSLSDNQYTLRSYCFSKRNLLGTIEHSLRALKNKLKV